MRLGLPALALVAATLVVSGPSGASIELDRAVAGVAIDMSPAQVRARLGAPDHVIHGPWRVGQFARTYRYYRLQLKIEFLLGGENHLFAYIITTRDPHERTRRGIGVGSSETEVRRRVPDVECGWDRTSRVRYCRRPREGGVGGTTFLLAGGRVVAVSVASPVF